MTKLLEARANALNSGDFEKLQVIQKDMTTLKNKEFESLSTPNYMWVTFKYDRAIDQAQDDSQSFTVYGKEFKFERAQHPSDIKFENREITESSFKTRKCFYVMGVVLCCIFFFFLCTYLITQMEIISFMQQPPLVSCDGLRKKYDKEQLFTLAFQEFYELRNNK